jgi:phosphate starvation-inducible PhoH-like protein
MSRSYSANSIKLESLMPFEPMTENQRLAKESWDKNNNLVLNGSAGTGKTYIALSMALEQVLDKETDYNELVIVRSIVPTRDIGFLPGDEEEKKQAYAAPYIGILKEIIGEADAWNKLITSKKLRFESTSFIRGTTFNNAIIVVDEMQNLNFHELDSVITRVGQECRFIMSGDYYQSDFTKDNDKKGILSFINIVSQLNQFDIIEFTWKDIVRSGFVRDYIMTKEMLGH